MFLFSRFLPLVVTTFVPSDYCGTANDNCNGGLSHCSRCHGAPICAISRSSLVLTAVSDVPSSPATLPSSVTAAYSASVRPTSASSSPSFVHLAMSV